MLFITQLSHHLIWKLLKNSYKVPIKNKWLAHSMARCNRIGSDCWLSEVAWVIKISNCCEWHWYRPRYRNIIVLPLCLSPHWHYTMHYWCLLLHATMALGTTPGSFTIDRLNCEWSNFAWIIHMATHCDFIWFSAQTGNILFASISFSGWYEIVVKYIHTI